LLTVITGVEDMKNDKMNDRAKEAVIGALDNLLENDRYTILDYMISSIDEIVAQKENKHEGIDIEINLKSLKFFTRPKIKKVNIKVNIDK
jgi:hypothetical protein